jgi:hypothetical protein
MRLVMRLIQVQLAWVLPAGSRQYHFAVVHPFRLLLIPRFLVNFLKVVKTRAYNNNSARNTQCINADSEKAGRIVR